MRCRLCLGTTHAVGQKQSQPALLQSGRGGAGAIQHHSRKACNKRQACRLGSPPVFAWAKTRFLDAKTGTDIEPVAIDAVTGAELGTRAFRVLAPK